jgi:hypothetical protein
MPLLHFPESRKERQHILKSKFRLIRSIMKTYNLTDKDFLVDGKIESVMREIKINTIIKDDE